MMTKKQQAIFIYPLMNTLMSICMSITGLLVNAGFLTLPMFAVTFGESLVICNLCNLVFRLPKLGVMGAMALSGGKPESRAFGVWCDILNPTLNTLCMNTFMTLINVGFRPEYVSAWLHSFPIMELVAVAVSFLTSSWLRKLACKLAGEEKEPIQ